VSDPVRVLVVDGDRRIQDVLRFSLGAFGMSVVGVASDGLEASTVFRQVKPRAVVLELRLSGQDGMTTLSDIRSVDPSCSVVVVTGSTDLDERQRALEMGAAALVSKPFRVDELFQYIPAVFQELLGRTEPALDPEYVRYAQPRTLGTTHGGSSRGSPRVIAPATLPPPPPSVPPPIPAVPAPLPGDANTTVDVLIDPPPAPAGAPVPTAAGGLAVVPPPAVVRPPALEPTIDPVRLRHENESLRRQLERARSEVESLRTGLDAVRRALDAVSTTAEELAGRLKG
jgi:CheY-like chemotaxis protein